MRVEDDAQRCVSRYLKTPIVAQFSSTVPFYGHCAHWVFFSISELEINSDLTWSGVFSEISPQTQPDFHGTNLEEIIRPRTRTVHIGVRRYTYNVVGTEYGPRSPVNAQWLRAGSWGLSNRTPVRDIKDIGFLLSVQIAM